MSFAAESRERARPVLPLAAMVDILFLLLVFFITASTFKKQEPAILIDLPPAQTGQAQSTQQTVTVITVTADNQIYIGDRVFLREEVADYLAKLYQASPDEPIYIRGDEYADLGAAVRLFDDAQAAGFTRVHLNVAELADE